MAESNLEKAGKAVAISCATTSNLVKVIKLTTLTTTPPNLFDVTFAQVGISNATKIRVFRQTLIELLPQIMSELRTIDLAPSVKIGLVVDVVEALLQQLAAKTIADAKN